MTEQSFIQNSKRKLYLSDPTILHELNRRIYNYVHVPMYLISSNQIRSNSIKFMHSFHSIYFNIQTWVDFFWISGDRPWFENSTTLRSKVLLLTVERIFHFFEWIHTKQIWIEFIISIISNELNSQNFIALYIELLAVLKGSCKL